MLKKTRRLGRLVVVRAAMATGLMVCAQGASAQVWDETIDGGGDAGPLPLGQLVLGTGTLGAITGDLENGADTVDMFCISVPDINTFNFFNSADGDGSTLLWLFDAAGNGVAHASGTRPSIGGQGLVTATGNHFIAVTRQGVQPEDASGNPIFPAIGSGQTGPNVGVGPIVGWFGINIDNPEHYQLIFENVNADDHNVDEVCDDCRTEAPGFTGFPGTVAVITQQGGLYDGLQVIDITNQGSAPSNMNWADAPFFPTAALNWSPAEIGTVFGTALDDEGNIYVAHSSVYGHTNNANSNHCSLPIGITPDQTGSLSGQLPGAIYRVSSSSGLASFLVGLPNLSDPAYTGGEYPANGSESYPGLGNIAFDSATGTLYASNHEDGAIYRVTASGTVLNAWLHRTGTIHAGNAVPNASPGFIDIRPDATTGRGQRVWAVQPHDGRLYYSVWREDTCPSRTDPEHGNEVWSVDLIDTGPNAGDFIPGSEQLEIDMASDPYIDTPSRVTSSPISDIAFTPACCMLIAERSMVNDTISQAHKSRVIEYCNNATDGLGWAPSLASFSPGFDIRPNSSAGGVAYDFDASSSIVQVWASADAISFPWPPDVSNPFVYGLLGMPSSGGSPSNGIWIDTDEDTGSHDKWQLGDVEISCPPRCGDLNDIEVHCIADSDGWTGCWDYTFTFTNNSGVDVHYILIADPNVDQHLIWLPTPVPDGATSESITIRICPPDGLPSGKDCYPLRLSLADANREECCLIEECVDLPDCYCIEVVDISVAGSPADLFDYSLTFSFTNQTGEVLEHMFVSADPPGSFAITPDYVDLPTVLPASGTVGPFNFDAGPLAPGVEYCILVSVHNEDLAECCSKKIVFRTPSAAPLGCPADLNEDGVLDLSDLTLFVSHFINGDPQADLAVPLGLLDLADLNAFVLLFTSGCP